MKPSNLCKQTDCEYCKSYKECLEIEYNNFKQQGKYSSIEFNIRWNNESE